MAWIAAIAVGAATLAAQPAWAQPVPGVPGAPPAPAAPGAPAVPAAGAPAGAAQAAAAPPGPLGVRNFNRVTFPVLADQLSYDLHPYLQYSGDAAFTRGTAATSDFSTIGSPGTDKGVDPVQSFIHSLPPFGFETGQTTGILLPKAVTIGFDYTKFSQKEKDVSGAKALDDTAPRMLSNTYVYQAALRIYALDPTETGLNYFVGIGLGVLDGRMAVQTDAFAAKRTVSYGQSPVGSTRLGLETKGENFGIRYEIMLLKAEKVRFSENPFPGRDNFRTIDFSGTLIRLALYYHFGDR
ncbi:MAG: hypothetical protein HY423_10000 [Candidatus Lambdaproteobacteria bacterium]|nr:hypothetical protein [Candidatus Lambdaproteobacteria bacterium]